jgi:hypothetical protein
MGAGTARPVMFGPLGEGRGCSESFPLLETSVGSGVCTPVHVLGQGVFFCVRKGGIYRCMPCARIGWYEMREGFFRYGTRLF